jgi:hypothetical protein
MYWPATQPLFAASGSSADVLCFQRHVYTAAAGKQPQGTSAHVEMRSFVKVVHHVSDSSEHLPKGTFQGKLTPRFR